MNIFLKKNNSKIMQEKEKTIREWLEELPEPYRTQAINNSTEERLSELPIC